LTICVCWFPPAYVVKGGGGVTWTPESGSHPLLSSEISFFITKGNSLFEIIVKFIRYTWGCEIIYFTSSRHTFTIFLSLCLKMRQLFFIYFFF
jgi:hypothetical protein